MTFPRLRAVDRAPHRRIGASPAVSVAHGPSRFWGDHLDATVNPGRHAVSVAAVAERLSKHLADARHVLPSGPQSAAVGLPHEERRQGRVTAPSASAVYHPVANGPDRGLPMLQCNVKFRLRAGVCKSNKSQGATWVVRPIEDDVLERR